MEPRLRIIGVRVVPGGRPTREDEEEGREEGTSTGVIKEGTSVEETAGGPPAE
jgi:hypothetical protein